MRRCFRACHFESRAEPGASLRALAEMARFNTSRTHGEEATRDLDRLLKTDALDYHAGHDPIGCQDIAWDIAGATVELKLSDSERNRLCRIVAEQSGHPVNRDLLALLTPCYPAFQMADHAMAANAAAPESGEAKRLRAAIDRYARRLGEIIATGCPGRSPMDTRTAAA